MDETKKRRFIWPVIALSCAPLLFILNFPREFTVSSVLLHLSALAGYVGVMFLLWMYILGAKSAMGVVFKDLAPVLTIHKSLGKWGSIAFLLHPIFVAVSYFDLNVKAVLYILVPNIDSAMESHVTLGRIAFYLVLIIWVSSKLARKKIGFRAWKYLHYFAYISLPFALLHVPDLGSQYMSNNLVKVYFWDIVGLLALFTLFRIGGWLNLDRKTYTIASHTRLTQQDYMYSLTPKHKNWLTPEPGQYVYIKQGIISEDHPFSLTYFDRATGTLFLTYRVFGSYTKFLTTLMPGKKVSLMGPFGSFTTDLQPESNEPVVYLAGGVGITPFAQRIVDENSRRVQLLFAANRTHESAVLVPYLKQILGNRLIAIYSREKPLDQTEEYGHISDQMLLRHTGTPQLFKYYMCGPQAFVDECKRVLKSMGVPDEQVHEEQFSW